MIKRSSFRLICAVMTFLMLCGSVNLSPAVYAADTSIRLSAYSLKLNPNASGSLQASAAGLETLVSWNVADSSIAAIAPAGSGTSGATANGANVTVTALRAGQTVITASVNGQSAQCLLTVSGVRMSPESVQIGRGGEQTLFLTRYGDAENVTFIWSSSNNSIAAVESTSGGVSAVVQGADAGSATVTASGGGYAATCQVRVSNAFAVPVVNGFLRNSTGQNNGFMLTYWFDAATVVNALCAVYDATERLLAVRTLDLSSETASDGTRQQLISCERAQAAEIKVFTLDASRRPIAPARILPTPDASSSAPEFVFAPEISANDWDRTSSALSRCYAQSRIMANQNCILYWALYSRQETYERPTASRFRTGTLTGSLRHGTQALTRNTAFTLEINALPQLTDYDLWLWLSSTDFTMGSYMLSLSFTTVDSTQPEFISAPQATSIQQAYIDLTTTLNEDSTIFWAVVEQGTVFPNPPTGGGKVTDDYAIRQIISGSGAMWNGSAPAYANLPTVFSVRGLQPQNTYDLWYTARDTSGNYSRFADGDPDNPDDPDCPRGVCMISITTLDTIAPTVQQEFTHHATDDETAPYDGTDIRLVFSEDVRRYSTGERFCDLYDAVTSARNTTERAAARETLAAALRGAIQFYEQSGTTQFDTATERNAGNESTIGDNWTVDYRYATAVTGENGETVITFPGLDSSSQPALRLTSGTSYYFRLNDISDTSDYLNRMADTRLNTFTTLSPCAELKNIALRSSQYPDTADYIDMAFSVTPGSTSHTDADDSWDMILWSDTTCEYELYVRSRPAQSATYDTEWKRVTGTGSSVSVSVAGSDTFIGRSLHYHFQNLLEMPALSSLQDSRVYEYAIRFLRVNGERNRSLWSASVNFRVSVVSGLFTDLANLAVSPTPESLSSAIANGFVTDISSPADMEFHMTRVFVDASAPSFSIGRPSFSPEDTSVEMRLQLTRPGTLYYLLAPADSVILPRDIYGDMVNWERAGEIPESGSDFDLVPFQVSEPDSLSIADPHYDGNGMVSGNMSLTAAATAVTVSGLLPNTNYFAYFVMRGSGQTFSEYAELYRFTTKEELPPVLSASFTNPTAVLTCSRAATLHYALINMDDSAFPEIFSYEFWNSQATGGRGPEYESQLGVRNVLQAMEINSEGSNSSVFDLYATELYKQEVMEYLSAVTADQRGLVIGARHDAVLYPQSRFTVDASAYPMTKGNRYVLIAVAVTDSGAESFRAVEPFSLPDDTPPLVVALDNGLEMDTYTGYTLETCHGRVTLTFNEYLYVKDTSVTPPVLKQLDRGPVSSSRRYAFPDFVGVNSIVENYASGLVTMVDSDEAQVGQPTKTLELEFTNAQNGAFVTLSRNLCDVDGNTRNAIFRVTVTLKQTGDTYTPEVTITSDWDGR